VKNGRETGIKENGRDSGWIIAEQNEVKVSGCTTREPGGVATEGG